MPSNGLDELQSAKKADWEAAYSSSSASAYAPPAKTRTFLREAAPKYDDEDYETTAREDYEVDEDAERSIEEQAGRGLFSAHDVATLLSAMGNSGAKPLTKTQRVQSARVPLLFTWSEKESPKILPVTDEMIMKANPSLSTSKTRFVQGVSVEHADPSQLHSLGARLFGMNADAPNQFVPGVATADPDHDGYTTHLPRSGLKTEAKMFVNHGDPLAFQEHGDIDYAFQVSQLEELDDKKNPGKKLPLALLPSGSELAKLLLEKEGEAAHAADGKLHLAYENLHYYLVHNANAMTVARRYKTKVLDKLEKTKFLSAAEAVNGGGVRVQLVRTTTQKSGEGFGHVDANDGSLSALQLQAAKKPQKSEWVLRFDFVESL